MIVRVCASTRLPSGTGLLIKSSFFNCQALIVATGRGSAPCRLESREPKGLNPIRISRIQKHLPGRTQCSYLRGFQQPRCEKDPIFGEIDVSGPRPLTGSAHWQFSADDHGLALSRCRRGLEREVPESRNEPTIPFRINKACNNYIDKIAPIHAICRSF